MKATNKKIMRIKIENIDKELQEVKLALKKKMDVSEFKILKIKVNGLEKEISALKHKLKIA